MELTASQKKAIQRQFDCFCKKVLREEARDYIRSMKRLAEKESSFSDLSEAQIAELSCRDEYPSELSTFFVRGQAVIVRNDRLADAISALPSDRQEIVLLSYFLDLPDREIAERLDMVRSTVQYKRKNALKEIKKKMEG